MGFEVEIAINGEQALEMYGENLYNLIILDGGLPDMKGSEVGKRIRYLEKENKMQKKPILLLSAYPADLLDQWCKEAEIDGFAIKPICPDKLFSILDGYFNNGVFSERAA